MRSILVDASPLIALTDRADKHHRRATTFTRCCEGQLFTTRPVLAMLTDWKEKFIDLPMDLADASLIRVARQIGVLEILTIDPKGFSVYRLPNGKALKPVL